MSVCRPHHLGWAPLLNDDCQHRLWKIHLRYISWGVPCHDILEGAITFWGGAVSPRPSGICRSITSETGQSHRLYQLWKKHLEVAVVSPPSPDAGVWSQFPRLPDRLALSACRSRWGSYHWWLEGSPPMYPPLLTPWTWRRSWVVSCRAAPLQRNIDETKRTPLTSSVMPGTIL